MSDPKVEHCHYDRDLKERVTREHRSSCTDPATHRGCLPCPKPHCVVCGRIHATNDHPITCPTCIGKTRTDLTEIVHDDVLLRTEAREGGRDGRLVAAAPIPGGVAQVLTGPSARLDLLRMSRQTVKDHRPDDPIPPLAILAQWEDLWREWLHHTQGPRASVPGAVRYLQLQLDHMAQLTGGGPDYLAFARQVRQVRAALEHALHDERHHQLGVDCFECPDGQLVRRFRRRKFCQHDTPARTWFRQAIDLKALGYPELGPTPGEVRAALRPCEACDQGGIQNPAAGQSWECLDCGKEYDPGEYASAVRRDLLDGDSDADGWTHITMAAEAASTLVGEPVSPGTVRKWIERGKAASRAAGPVRLVFWPDVADAAVEMKRRRAEQALIVPRPPGEHDGERNPDGARWCTRHDRWECAQAKKLRRGGYRCHGTALRDRSTCRAHTTGPTAAIPTTKTRAS